MKMSLPKKKKKKFFFLGRLPPFRAKFRPLGRLFRPIRPLAWSLHCDVIVNNSHCQQIVYKNCLMMSPLNRKSFNREHLK